MSTYIQGVDEYIPQIQQFQPDFTFFANALQYKQSKYDAAREQISDVYYSILNNPMIREQDIAKREEFFKQIDSDIKKISKMDLSLRQNQNIASHVFNQLLDDKNIAHDMVFTKKVQSVLSEGEGLKQEGDDRYWDGNERLVNHIVEAYQNASNDDALSMSAPKYIYKKDIGKEISDLLLSGKLKFDVSTESPYVQATDKNGNPIYTVDENGNKTPVMKQSDWIVKRKNGELVEPYLNAMFMGKYAEDSYVREYYTAVKRLERLDWVKSHKEEYGSEEAANNAYIQSKLEGLDQQWKAAENEIEGMYSNQQDKIASAENGLKEAERSNDTEAYEEWQKKIEELTGELESIQSTKSYISKTANQLVNMNGNITPELIDNILAGNDIKQDIYNGAKIASMQGYEVSYKENPYRLEEIKFQNQIALEKAKQTYDEWKTRFTEANKLKAEMIKAGMYDDNNALVNGLEGTVYNMDLQSEKDNNWGSNVVDYISNAASSYLMNQNLNGESMYDMEGSILSEQLLKLKEIADSDSPKACYARQAYVNAILSSMSESEAESIVQEVNSGDYQKLYNKIKGKTFIPRSINAFTLDNIYNSTQNLIREHGITINVSQQTLARQGRITGLNNDWEQVRTGMLQNIASVLGKYDEDSDDHKALRAYLGLRKNQKLDEWNGRLATYNEFLHLANNEYGINRGDVINYWDTEKKEKGSVQNMFGKGYDNIMPYTSYAEWSGRLRGAGDYMAVGVSGNVTNQINDKNRQLVWQWLQDATGASSVEVVVGLPQDGNSHSEENLLEARVIKDVMNNIQDSKSAAVSNYGFIYMPIMPGDASRCGFYIYDAKEDDPDKRKAYTISVDKKDVAGTTISKAQNGDWMEDVLYMYKGDVNVPLRDPSSNVRIRFDDARRQIVVSGTMDIFNKATQKIEKVNMADPSISMLYAGRSASEVARNIQTLEAEALSAKAQIKNK